MSRPRVAFLIGASVILLGSTVSAQPVEAVFEDGLLSVSCANAPVSTVFERIEEVTGVELTLEDAVKTKRLTADLAELPVAMAVQRLLEGSGLNYVVMMDPRDWGRVNKVFVGAGGGGPARSAPPPRRAPAPMPSDMDEEDDFADFEDDFDDEFMDDEMMDEEMMDEEGMNEQMPGDFQPPGSSPIPNYLPQQQTFPKSRFTPGPPSQPQAQPQQQQGQQGGNAPPAMMPFMDPFGRPIPVPADQNQQRRQQQQQ